MEIDPLTKGITSFFPDVSPITQRQEGREMPSRKSVLREERGHSQASAGKEGVRIKSLFILGNNLWGYIWLCPGFSRQQPAPRLAQMGCCSLVSSGTCTQLWSEWAATVRGHLCSPLLAKDRKEHCPNLSSSSPITVLRAQFIPFQSSPCCNPALLRRPKHSRQGKCAALSESSQETSLQQLG